MAGFLSKTFKKVVDKVFDVHLTCNMCREEVFNGEVFCPECKKRLHPITADRCATCGRQNLKPVEACASCKNWEVDKARSSFDYHDGASRLIKALKYDGAAYLAPILAGYMFRTYVENLFAPDVITFVPMTEKEKFLRGYNHAEKLCDELCALLDIEPSDILEKKFETENQVGLDYAERKKNLKGSFGVKEGVDLKGKKVLIVDDVVTTGATAGEIAEVLKKRHADSVYLITVASVSDRVVFDARNAENDR
ncbi:MAG: ComF family protein [Clostridia bacterium]|nr:ComF family protein [Clostridia bacterium]